MLFMSFLLLVTEDTAKMKQIRTLDNLDENNKVKNHF